MVLREVQIAEINIPGFHGAIQGGFNPPPPPKSKGNEIEIKRDVGGWGYLLTYFWGVEIFLWGVEKF